MSLVQQGGPADTAVTSPEPGPEREFTVEARSQRQQIIRRFVRNRSAMVGLGLFVALMLVAFAGPLVYPHSLSERESGFDAFEAGPGYRGHWLGLGNIGYDLLALIMHGIQRSMYIALIVIVVGGFLGVLVGALAGYFSGWVDNLLMRLIDLLLTIPSLIILIVFTSKFPDTRSYWLIGLFIAVFGWFDLGRLVRGSFLSLREREFVEAAHALGASNRRIIFKHLIPNALGTIIVWVTLAAATAVLAEATLAYLGYGVSEGYSLGRLVSEGVAAADSRWWLFYFPGLTLVLIVMSINLVGDGIRDAFDPSHARVRA